MTYTLQMASTQPANQTLVNGSAVPVGTTVFNIRKPGFKLLLCHEVGVVQSPAPGRELSRQHDATYENTRTALQHLGVRDTRLLILARQRLRVSWQHAQVEIPEGRLVLLPGGELDLSAFEHFRGTILLLREAVLSPLDRKLLAQRPDCTFLDCGWSRLLGDYLASLETATLHFILREATGWTLVEQQVMALLRRAMRERLSGMRCWKQDASVDRRPRGRGELLFSNLCTWVTDHFAMPEMSTELVVSHFEVSPRYIQSLFATYGGGATFVSYLREQRLHKGLQMLGAPDHAHQTISEISWHCGFADPVYFGKVFRDQFGMTPGEARRLGSVAQR